MGDPLEAPRASLTLPTYDASDYSQATDQTVLGRQVVNPYSLTVVREAYAQLLGDPGFPSDSLHIAPSHLYVRFAPQTLEDEFALARDSSLTLFDVPLDHEIAIPGSSYRDPAVADGHSTYLYTAVRADYPLAGLVVEYEVLDTLYQPEVADGSQLAQSQQALDALELRAAEIAGRKTYGEGYEPEARPSYCPWARVRFRDDDQALKSLEGARVTFRRWSKYGEGFTNTSGIATSDKCFSYEVNYQLIWERYHFAVRDSWLNRAKIDGPQQKDPWLLDIGIIGDADWRRAQVHRGALHYYYKDILGLARPPQNGVISFQLHYRVKNEPGDALGRHCPACQWLGFGSQIKIWINSSGLARDYYATTIHETAHASHWKLTNDELIWANCQSRVKESWARGVQWSLTQMTYSSYTPRYFDEYTGIVQDLVDGTDGTSGYDQVSGYTLPELEHSIKWTMLWEHWRERIRHDHVNPTENNLTNLFNYWQ